MSKIIFEELQEAKKRNKIVSIHTDPLAQAKCEVGYVDEINDSWVRIRSVSPEGLDDGYIILFLENIFRIGVNDKYLNKVEFIKAHASDVFVAEKLLFPIDENNIIFTTLREAKQKALIVILWTEDEGDSIIGYVNAMDEDTVKILEIDDYGNEIGFIIVDLSAVSHIACNNLKCQMIKFLNQSLGFTVGR